MTIEYSAPRAARVQIRVYDVCGRLMDVLVDGTTPGSAAQRVVWKGRDESGSKVSAGVYTIVLEADGRLFTRKILRLE